jgi:hypothetical protein
MTTLSFGKIINIKEQDYVYLGATLDIVYLAQIVDVDMTKRILIRYQKLQEFSPRKNDSVYKVVQLTTADFVGCGAHCHKTEKDSNILEANDFMFKGDLNDKDKNAIKEELLVNDGFVNKELQELIRGFN